MRTPGYSHRDRTYGGVRARTRRLESSRPRDPVAFVHRYPRNERRPSRAGGGTRERSSQRSGRRQRIRRDAGHARLPLTAAAHHTWNAVAPAAVQSLQTLRQEALPPARLARPEAVEIPAGVTLVLHADWHDETRWSRALTAWTQSVGAADPITLALHCGDTDPDALVSVILNHLLADGRNEDSLPDLMLCRADVQLRDLVAAADAVLIDDCDRERPELVRRAPCLIPAEPTAMRALLPQIRTPMSSARERLARRAA